MEDPLKHYGRVNLPPGAPRLRFHVVSLPHTQTTYDYEACAYTAKQRKLCNMLKSLGHTVYLYAGEQNDAACDELIPIVKVGEQRKWFGEYDFRQQFFNISWDPAAEHWVETNRRAIDAIRRRLRPRDIICLVAGICQKPIAMAFADQISIESGIGYKGTFAKYRVFESYAWMHYVYGQAGDDNGKFFDAVIPNYFEPWRFKLAPKKEDYFVFLGRLIKRKGPDIAVEVTRRLGARLILAGQGVVRQEGNKIIAADVTLQGDHIEHIGHVDVAARARLLSRARGVFMGTTYLEPFGGVAIESMLCGTPVIASDFGAFPENVIHGQSGYRFRTMGEAVWAAQNVGQLDPRAIRRYAVQNFSVNRIKYLYQAYFEQLNSLWNADQFWTNDSGVSQYHRYQRF